MTPIHRHAVRWTLLVGLGVLLGLVAIPGKPASADTSVAVSFFYDDLEPDGFWVEHRHYGVVWYPRDREGDWQPYTRGRWVWTTDYGWYWESGEPWGWAAYHYGRWAYTSEYGWVWVPGDEWGPAWVEWRHGDGHVGWAPMPPEVAWRDDTFVYAGVDLSQPRYHSSWVFIGEAEFARGDFRARRVPPSRNAAMVRASARVTNYATVNARIVNRSIDVARVSAAAKVRINPARVVLSERLAGGGAHAAGQVSIYRPRVVARAGLDLTPPRFDVPAGVETEGQVEVRRPREPSVDGSLDGSVGGGLGVGGQGGGLGVGVGGGLRIGR